jgi:glycosyltransferase involved in cell wall biosynthesis
MSEYKINNIAVFAPGYPSSTDAAFAFVHARVKLYLQRGKTVKVFIPGNQKQYSFEGVEVYAITNDKIASVFTDWKPDVLAVHYANFAVKKLVKGIDLPMVVWVHGHEILWTTDVTAGTAWDKIRKKFLLLPRLIHQTITTGRFIGRAQVSVFVSQWMKQAAEKHAVRKFINGIVIPNPVDTDLFFYRKPTSTHRCISIRSFAKNKYGIDTAIRAFSGATDLQIDIYGKGKLAEKFRKLALTQHSNANIIEKSIPHGDIPALYHQYDIFVAPSRVEAQGVSMCEAMAAGLPIVATHVGGIPEFVRHGKDGFLVPPNNPEELMKAIRLLSKDRVLFEKMSSNAREHIHLICGADNICNQEIEAMETAVKLYNNNILR